MMSFYNDRGKFSHFLINEQVLGNNYANSNFWPMVKKLRPISCKI